MPGANSRSSKDLPSQEKDWTFHFSPLLSSHDLSAVLVARRRVQRLKTSKGMWGARQHPHGAKGKMRAKEQRRRREQWRPRAKAARCTRFQRYRGRLFYASFCLSACHCFRNHCRRNGSCHKSTYTKLLRMVDPCVCMCLVCFGRRFRKHCPAVQVDTTQHSSKIYDWLYWPISYNC
uniref:Uncharacterized protein n=1 Tax=Rhipicephalus microplus TaxID=6941 RepID=A0A6G5AFI6_RHIMP